MPAFIGLIIKDHGNYGNGPLPMSHIRLLSAAVVALALAAPAAAAEAPTTSEYTACMDASGGVHPDMMDCIAAETERWDAVLNQSYKKLAGALDDPAKAALKDAQRKWIAYRDAECNLAYMAAGGDEGGQMAPLAANDCMMSLTAIRASELTAYLAAAGQ